MGNYSLRKMFIEMASGNVERRWMIIDETRGHTAHPLAILTDLEMQRIADEYQHLKRTVAAVPRPARRVRAERGGIMLGFAFVLLLLILGIFAMVLMMASLPAPGSFTGEGGAAASAPSGSAGGADPNGIPIEAGELDSGGSGLQCIFLPGVSYPKTPALDRRIARRYLAVKQALDAAGVRNLTFTWAFRTNCQQRLVNAGPNLKAAPGSSPHEAGRALDVSGMRVRGDAAKIVSIFRNGGARWLGQKDPPHFDWEPGDVGENSSGAMIRKNQAAWQQGVINGGCKGTECGPYR